MNQMNPEKDIEATVISRPTIIGHKKLVDYLVDLQKYGKISHASLIIGPPHVGKTTLARWILKTTACIKTSRPCGTCPGCKEVERNAHPDINTLPDSNEPIPIEAVRKLRSSLHTSPFSIGSTWGFIPNAERLTEQAANALLKELEEPNPNVHFLLTSSHPERLLPTIRSRSHELRCQLVPASEIHDALTGVGVSRNTARRTARIAQGRPGIAIRYLKDPTFQKQLSSGTRNILRALTHPTKTARLKTAAWLSELPKETSAEALAIALREGLMAALDLPQYASGIVDSNLLKTSADTATTTEWKCRLESFETYLEESTGPSKHELTLERFFLNV